MSREVNYLYFLIVLVITLTVLGIALYTKNKRAVKMFVFAMGIWALIEGIGLVTGMRVYTPAEDNVDNALYDGFHCDPPPRRRCAVLDRD